MATIQDARRIAGVQVDSWRAAYPGMVPDAYLAALDVDRREKVWAGLCGQDSAPLLVACGDDGITGFCHVSASRDDDSAGTAEITSIYVDPAHWRKGHGRELISGAVTFAVLHGYRSITLWVLSKNERAKRFYESMGFVPDGAVKTEKFPDFQFDEVRYRREWETASI